MKLDAFSGGCISFPVSFPRILPTCWFSGNLSSSIFFACHSSIFLLYKTNLYLLKKASQTDFSITCSVYTAAFKSHQKVAFVALFDYICSKRHKTLSPTTGRHEHFANAIKGAANRVWRVTMTITTNKWRAARFQCGSKFSSHCASQTRQSKCDRGPVGCATQGRAVKRANVEPTTIERLLMFSPRATVDRSRQYTGATGTNRYN